jgi:hypothetical protein
VCCVLCAARYGSLGILDHSSKRSPTECGGSLCVIKKPRERGGHSVLGCRATGGYSVWWAAEEQEGIACAGL